MRLALVRGIASAFLTGLLWMVLAVVLGLAQLWLNYGVAAFRSMSIGRDVLEDGVLLFFAMALTASVCLDYHFDEELDRLVPMRKLWKGIIFYFVPGVIILLVTYVYMCLLFDPEKALKTDVVVLAHWSSILAALLLCLFCKTLLFCKAAIRNVRRARGPVVS